MRLGEELLYLSRAEVEATGVTLAEIEKAVEGVFTGPAAGGADAIPKTSFRPAPEAAHFLSMPGALGDPPLAMHKWVGLSGANAVRKLPHLGSLIVISDLVSGMPVAFLDGTWITAARTAAMSTVAARRLARRDSKRIGFVGSGVQAAGHLAALRGAFAIEEIAVFDRVPASAAAFAAAADGLEARLVDDARLAVEGMDIVVTTIPAAPDLKPFLKVAWLGPGAFATMVDLGRSWKAAGFECVECIAVDSYGQEDHLPTDRGFPYSGPFHADLAELIGAVHPGRRSADDRTIFIHPGMALPDMAVAAVIYQRAREQGRGTVLPL
ncbi:MAG: ornithine cyclodeaminase family protein [Rhodospirillales bacterium]|jgi:ornithine cyclodeaminase/alanine dehydrogenase|nr:ornithine cyclodeaminase family protein [Rhodospirillales bacterium]MDP6882575.1 ornithine cyclodeaminase family protein [Rhodospirillales bacterium]